MLSFRCRFCFHNSKLLQIEVAATVCQSLAKKMLSKLQWLILYYLGILEIRMPINHFFIYMPHDLEHQFIVILNVTQCNIHTFKILLALKSCNIAPHPSKTTREECNRLFLLSFALNTESYVANTPADFFSATLYFIAIVRVFEENYFDGQRCINQK